MKKILCAAGCLIGSLVFAEETVVSVDIDSIKQRYPWNGKVDVDFTLRSTDPAAWVRLEFAAVDTTVNPATNLTALSFNGASGNRFAATAGVYRVTWDTDIDLPGTVIDAVEFKITALAPDALPVYERDRYVVVDLSEGYEGSPSYPVHRLPAPPLGGFNTDEYKTSKMAFVKLPATVSDEWKAISGGKPYFVMGSPTDEKGRWGGSGGKTETQHEVTLEKSFHMAIFEVTQKQYWYIIGNNPAWYRGDKRPVTSVSYNALRGSVADGIDWPVTKSKDDPSVADPMRVSDTGLIGLMRARTAGCIFDLPTEAEWEYACRAGTSTAYYNGLNPNIVDNHDAGLSEIACYMYVDGYNRNQDKDGNAVTDQYADPAVNFSNNVGSYRPNAFGLYDMLGNVSEHCRDWYADFSAAAATDPKGPESGTTRLSRGGAWNYDAGYARAACRNPRSPTESSSTFGFRLALYLND